MPTTAGPVSQKYRAELNELAKTLDEIFNGTKRPKTIGFGVVMFEFGNPTDQSRINWISNAAREDMFVALKELVARWEGRLHDSETKQ